MAKTDKALHAIYRELGYLEPLPRDEGKTRPRGDPDVPRDAPEAIWLPPLDENTLRIIQNALKERSEEFFEHFRKKYGYSLADDEIRRLLSEAREAFEHSEQFLEKLRRERKPGAGEKRR